MINYVHILGLAYLIHNWTL